MSFSEYMFMVYYSVNKYKLTLSLSKITALLHPERNQTSNCGHLKKGHGAEERARWLKAHTDLAEDSS